MFNKAEHDRQYRLTRKLERMESKDQRWREAVLFYADKYFSTKEYKVTYEDLGKLKMLAYRAGIEEAVEWMLAHNQAGLNDTIYFLRKTLQAQLKKWGL